MPVATITENGNPWIRTSLQTRKVGHIKRNSEVHMIWGAKTLESTENYLQIVGRAEINADKQERHHL
ncbi:MAG: pyridoxamine 5'-phosphate oxidase family protein [Candidatus Aminicenantes bacterium]|nr:MAG: pyridoxamine 5'-phosphate oxidase family protein [Candidatus Aminicenantes bacterium]